MIKIDKVVNCGKRCCIICTCFPWLPTKLGASSTASNVRFIRFCRSAPGASSTELGIQQANRLIG